MGNPCYDLVRVYKYSGRMILSGIFSIQVHMKQDLKKMPFSILFRSVERERKIFKQSLQV